MKIAKIITAAAASLLLLGGCGVIASADTYTYAQTVSAARTSVKSRDWSKYSSTIATARLTAAERTFYERVEAECRKWISTADTPTETDSEGKYYTDYIEYGSLGLSDETAYRVALWFIYNNPQYYFLSGGSLHYPNDKMCISFYDFAVDGEKRAKITNTMFNKLDGWIAECSGKPNIYQTLRAINRKICENITYDPQVKAGESANVVDHNQTIYSVLMTKYSVCAGYAKTFSAMANALGIDSISVDYPGIHAWNIVKFDDGNYYYVDVTWDDLDDGRSEYYEQYMGFGTDTAQSIDSHIVGQNVVGFIPKVSKSDYVVKDSDLVGEFRAPNIKAEKTDTGVAFWWDEVGSAASYEFQLSYDEEFSFIAGSATPDNNWREVRYNLTTSEETLFYGRVRSVDSKGNTSPWSTVLYDKSAPVYPRGDVDGSGKANAADATLILKSVVSIIQLTPEQYARADLNNDGHVNSADATMVLKIVVNLA